MSDNVIQCGRCGAALGYDLPADVMQAGGLALTEAHGVCARCGEAFHRSLKVKLLGSLVVQQNGQGFGELIVQLRMDGVSWRNVAKQVGRSVGTCRRVYKREIMRRVGMPSSLRGVSK